MRKVVHVYNKKTSEHKYYGSLVAAKNGEESLPFHTLVRFKGEVWENKEYIVIFGRLVPSRFRSDKERIVESKMSKYQYTEKCIEVSGFGGGYEDACRKMVQTGMEWLDKHKEANPTFDQFKNVYGLTTNENDDMKDMQSAMNEAISNGASGAMMQVSTNHVLYAHKNGWEKYISEMEKVTAD
jgi:hypothetical protein